ASITASTYLGTAMRNALQFSSVIGSLDLPHSHASRSNSPATNLAKHHHPLFEWHYTLQIRRSNSPDAFASTPTSRCSPQIQRSSLDHKMERSREQHHPSMQLY